MKLLNGSGWRSNGKTVNNDKEYCFQPHRYLDTGHGTVFTPTYLDESGNSYPDFNTLDEAITYIQERNLWGCVQRYLKAPAREPGPEPDSQHSFGAWSFWFGRKLDWERGYSKVTAGVAWVSAGAPVSLIIQMTARSKEYRGGTLYQEDVQLDRRFWQAAEGVSEGGEPLKSLS